MKTMRTAESSRKWWTLAVVGSGSFMAALDGSVVNVALPIIGKTTHSVVSTVEWVILVYLITVSASLLVFGRLADIHGKRAIYMAGQLVFVLGSLCCGLSGTIGFLIAFRAVQAIGAAMIFALSPAILISAFPATERGRALGMQATLTYLGLAIGPGLGGVLTQHFGWPSIFMINLPIGLGMWVMAYKTLHPDGKGEEQPFDPVGALAMAVALASLLLVLSKGGDLGWGHPLIVGLAVLAAGAGAVLIRTERRCAHPALDLGLFHNRRFTASVLAAYLCYLSMASVSFLLPFYLLSAAGYSPSKAGLVLMAVPLAMISVTGPSGIFSDKVGVRLPATLGLTFMATGLFLLGSLDLSYSAGHIAACLAVVGVGVGMFTAPNNSAIMGSVPKNRQGVTGALLAAARTVGFATGVAMAGLIYTAALNGPHETATPENIARAVRTGMRAIAFFALAAAACSLLRGTRQPEA
jgi:EmrB/QacA subfamily drug resistance transporter